MQLPHRNTPVIRCERLAQYAVQALRGYGALFGADEGLVRRLESVAGTLEQALRALTEAQNEYRAAVVAVLGPRVELKLVDLKADDLVRSVKRAAEDQGRDVADAVFPDGITPIVKPVGQTQVAALRALEGRLAAASRWADREPHRARLEAVRIAYETALEKRRVALLSAADKNALREAVREDFLDVYAAAAAAVKGTFPRDRARQDAFFDAVRSGRGEAATEAEVEAEADDEAEADETAS